MQKIAKTASADAFERLLAGLPIGIERIDTEGRIVYSNPAHHAMLGYAAGEIIGRKIYEFVADAEQTGHLKTHLEHLAEHQPEPEPWVGSNRRKDGTIFEMRVDWQYEHDDQGNLLGFVAAMTDISAQRKAESERDRSLEALKANRAHMVSLMNSAEKFVLYRLATIPDDPFAGEVVLVSPSIREVMGVDDPQNFSSWFANIHPDDQARVVDANRLSSETGAPFDEEMRINHPKKNEVRWIRAISMPIADENGTPLYFNGLIVDITNERRAEEYKRQIQRKLQQSQRLESLGTLAGGIAHDFNNYLVGILGNSDIALELMRRESPARQPVENIATAAQRAADLTNELLAYSGRGNFDIGVTSLNDIVTDMASILKPAISKKAQLDLDLAASLPDIQVDISQIRQVIMNLMMNASDALADEPGTIRVTSSDVVVEASDLQTYGLPKSCQGGRYVRLAVTDTGCGMDTKTMARIYDPFFTSKSSGRGLGLAAVRSIIQGHLGEIHVASTPGHGSRFSVFLPVAEQTDAKQTKNATQATGLFHESQTILVVDDEDLVRNVAAKMLEVNGHQVLTAVDGRDALEVFTARCNEIDAVLLDMNMPKMSGHDTFKALRKLRHDLPVVFSTGYHEQDLMHLLDTETGVEFIQKPYRLSKLLEKFHAIGT